MMLYTCTHMPTVGVKGLNRDSPQVREVIHTKYYNVALDVQPDQNFSPSEL